MTIKRSIRNRVYASLSAPELAGKRRQLSDSGRGQLEQVLRIHYFSQPLNYFAATPEEYLFTSEGQKDLAAHMDERIALDRECVIPWLASKVPLNGCRVLEIGCGTGASTVALAEQGCRVTAVDVNQDNLRAAEARCGIYDLSAQFLCCNATEVHGLFPAGSFDLIVFFATLEHLTCAERLQAMKGTWEMLAPGAFWCVVDTPNRLWWLDEHTSGLPFFNWLPDDLALDYAPHSDRSCLKTYASAGRDEAVKLDFARRGRGVSYHEFDLALGDSDSLDVISAYEMYARSCHFAFRAQWLLSPGRKYESLLRQLGPKIHPGFYQKYLNLLLRKH